MNREDDASRKRKQRAEERAIVIPHPQNLERRESLEVDTLQWLSYYLHTAFADPFTQDQEEMIASTEAVMQDGSRQAIAAPRGDGKTTIVKGVIVKAICTGLLDFIVGIGATGRQTEEAILEGVKYEFEVNDRLAADYPEICFPVRAMEGSPRRATMQTHLDADGVHRRTDFQWAGDGVVFPTVINLEWMNKSNAKQIEIVEKIDGKDVSRKVWASRASDICFRTRGLDAAILGLIYHNRRPKFVLVDDPDTEESASSPVQTEKRCKTLRRSIAHLGGKRRMGVVLLTTIRALDSVSDIFTDPKREPSYNGRRYRALKTWPEREELWDEYVAIRRTYEPMVEGARDKAHKDAVSFYVKNRVDMERQAEVSNPYRFDIENGQLSALQRCFDIIADDGREAFETECQNNPPTEEKQEEAGITDLMVRSRVNGRMKCVCSAESIGLTIGIDVGKYACFYSTVAWMPQGYGEVIDYDRIEVHNPNEIGIEKAITTALLGFRDNLIAEPYVNQDGEPVTPRMVFIDAQYQTDAVHAFCKASGTPYYPTHGYGTGHPGMKAFHVPSAGTGVVVGDHLYSKIDAGIRQFHIDADHWKAWVHSRFMIDVGKPASLSLYGADPRVHTLYSAHLTSETQVDEFIRGKGVKRSWKKTNRNNHWFDSTSLASAAGSLLGVSVVPKPVSVNTAAARRPRARVTGGWQR
jgi:hypothetical protein